ncbi:DUF6461 domain-containing protein (plasmid) [Streptomyces sp. BI20]|uniref:DUF6461 domain-containing protein n=1 Tax=Streptomyces sp. BI20 TaxID=3403460 RepID=UPI003C76F82E
MVSSGVRWLAEEQEGDWAHALLFARGVAPEELARRLGGVRGPVSGVLTGSAALNLVLDPSGQSPDLVRVGAHGGWSFAVEYGFGGGAAHRLDEISRHGVEAICLDPSPDHPPMTFAYARDGLDVCGFGIGEECWRWGGNPDLLLPELVAAGILHPDGTQAFEDGPHRDRVRDTLALIEDRFGLALPRGALWDEPLPAFVIR